jgi:DMSO/TMAO reductase YedYZ molybdopterin-dependent catalytic subunit
VAVDDRAIGRAAFLGVVGAGIAGLFYARDATGLLGRLVPRSLGALVPTSGWRIYTIGSTMPSFDPGTYTLTVEGLVERPVRFTLADLEALPRAEQISDFHCVTGWSVHDVQWTGVRLGDLLEAARAKAGIGGLRFVSAEAPYDDSLTLEQALLPDVLLAYEMDGAPISRPHGAPLRLVMPRMYGYKSVKWVERIVLQESPQAGYWEQHGYDADAWIGDSNGLAA